MSEKTIILLLIIILLVLWVMRPESYPGLPFPPTPPKPKVTEPPEIDYFAGRKPRDDIPGYENPGPIHYCPTKEDWDKKKNN